MLSVILLCMVVVAAATPVQVTDPELDDSWNAFKKTFTKVYETEWEEKFRRVTWESNLEQIQTHNLQADLKQHTFHMGINKYSDMTGDEIRKTMNGYRANSTEGGSLFLAPTNIQVPAEMDWRKKGYVTPVKDQASCGSCWAFSTTGSLEGQHFKQTGKLISLSEQNLVDCSIKQGNHGCGGGLMDNAFTYIKVNDGIDTEMSYPYEAKDDKCRFRVKDVGADDTGFMDIESGSEEDLLKAVTTIGPISVAIDAGQMSFHSYSSGVYVEPKCSSKFLDHGVLVVGFGEQDGQKYWLVKNSWGDSWGMNGYIMMARDMDNMCGIATSASYPLV